MTLQYITNQKGKQSAVLISLDDWNKFQEKYEKLKNKLNILTGIQDALEEVKQIKTGKKKGKTLRQFLDGN